MKSTTYSGICLALTLWTEPTMPPLKMLQTPFDRVRVDSADNVLLCAVLDDVARILGQPIINEAFISRE
jgi:hypothetical protein